MYSISLSFSPWNKGPERQSKGIGESGRGKTNISYFSGSHFPDDEGKKLRNS